MKFGGTSVANVERIRNVAGHVKREIDAGSEIAVVVSAMAGKTTSWSPGARSRYRGAATPSTIGSSPRANWSPRACWPWCWRGHGPQVPLMGRLADPDPDRRRPRRGPHDAKIDGAALVDGFGSGEVGVVAGFQGLNGASNKG